MYMYMYVLILLTRSFLNICSNNIIITGMVDQDECSYIAVIVCCVRHRLVWFASLCFVIMAHRAIPMIAFHGV